MPGPEALSMRLGPLPAGRRRRLLPLATGALAAYSWRGPVSDFDVIVVGAGNAALAAAAPVREQGAVRVFHGNYPGGTGLISGAVFGRLAGAQAAVE